MRIRLGLEPVARGTPLHEEEPIRMTIEAVPSLFAYFHAQVAAASERHASEAPPGTVDYLARLLVSQGAVAGSVVHRSVVLHLNDALTHGPGEQFAELLSVGDAALYGVGFFPAALERAGLDLALYVHLGAFAYGRAAELAGTAGAVLGDLQVHFARYADVLGEVAESSALGAMTKTLVQQFDRWKALQSARALDAMARAGAYPVLGGRRNGSC